MKNEDLFYAMNFLDEDLIDEAKKLDDKAVVTSIEPAKKVRKKARIMPLVASWAAAATVLVVGGIILFTSKAGTSDSSKGMRAVPTIIHNAVAENDRGVVEEADEESFGGSVSTWNTSIRVDEDPDNYSNEDSVEIVDGPVVATVLDIYDEPVYFTFNGTRFLFVDEIDQDEAERSRGEQLGVTSECDIQEYDDHEVYEYTSDGNMVLVYFPDEGVYGIAIVAEQ